MKFNIKDTAFAHDKYSVAGQTTDKFEWVRDGSGDNRFEFYTNEQCYNTVDHTKINIAWLVESKGIVPHIYDNFSAVADNFDLIFTHSSDILNSFPHAKWIFGYGYYVGTNFGGGECKIYDKSKLCSIVCSNKLMCNLHAVRMNCANICKQQFPFDVDVYGTINDGEWVPIINSLDDYKYSIVVENYIDDLFFTEKLTNCFMTGTVPIYVGASKIDTIFDIDGIIQFQSYEDLESIVDYLKNNPEDYSSRLPAIKKNLEIAKQYRIMEDYIYDVVKEKYGI